VTAKLSRYRAEQRGDLCVRLRVNWLNLVDYQDAAAFAGWDRTVNRQTNDQTGQRYQRN
jgi:hypothetical protein